MWQLPYWLNKPVVPLKTPRHSKRYKSARRFGDKFAELTPATSSRVLYSRQYGGKLGGGYSSLKPISDILGPMSYSDLRVSIPEVNRDYSTRRLQHACNQNP